MLTDGQRIGRLGGHGTASLQERIHNVALSGINSGSGTALRGLESANAKQAEAIKQLVSGLKINRAGDDAAGLSISTHLQSQLRGLNTASSNGQNAISLLQVADGGLEAGSAHLQRVRELTVRAAGTSDPGALDAITKEIGQSLSEIDRISQSTTFGNNRLLDGSLSNGTKFQIGATGTSSEQFNVTIPDTSHSSLGLGGIETAIRSGDTKTALDAIDNAMKSMNDTRNEIGSAQNSLGSAVSALTTEMLNVTGANSRIMDADYAQSLVDGSIAGIQAQASIIALSHSNTAGKQLVGLLRA